MIRSIRAISIAILLMAVQSVHAGVLSEPGQQGRRAEPIRITVRIGGSGPERLTAPIPIRLDGEGPFLSIGTTWRDEPVALFEIALRSSPDGEVWSDWRPLRDDPETAGSEGRASLTIVDAATRYLQYRVLSRSGGAPERIGLTILDPGRSPESLTESYLKRMRAEEKGFNGGVARPKPAVVSRTEWGCPDGEGTSRPPVSYTTVTHLIVHHTVNENSSTDWAAVVRSIWNFHFYDRGYIDIGYNYLIDPNGVIYEGRSGGDNVQGAHFSGVNGGTMGVAMLGTYIDLPPTGKAMESLRRLLAWKADQRGLLSYGASLHAASGIVLKTISGHRDGPGSTECPGDALYTLLPGLRAEVQNEIAGTGIVTPVSAASYAGGTLASGSIVAAYGSDLARTSLSAETLPLPESLGGVRVRVLDRLNTERYAPLFYVSPGQINLLLPEGTAPGPATLLVDNGSDQPAAGSIEINSVSPGLFTANSDGAGVPAALILRLSADSSTRYEPVALKDSNGRFITQIIDFGPETDQLFLVAFGTGFRNRSGLGALAARLGGLDLEVLYAGPAPDYAGLDQINLRLPRKLAGGGELLLEIIVDGRPANQVRLRF